jgi:hypothetical protein
MPALEPLGRNTGIKVTAQGSRVDRDDQVDA